jgi:hypothetical protein
MRHSWRPFAHDIRHWQQGEKYAINGAHFARTISESIDDWQQGEKCAIHGAVGANNAPFMAPIRP